MSPAATTCLQCGAYLPQARHSQLDCTPSPTGRISTAYLSPDAPRTRAEITSPSALRSDTRRLSAYSRPFFKVVGGTWFHSTLSQRAPSGTISMWDSDFSTVAHRA